MEVRLLGPLELADGGRLIAYGGARQRAVLALLVLHANQVVPSERVLLELWGEDAPPGGQRPPGGRVATAPGAARGTAGDAAAGVPVPRLHR